MLFKKFGEFDSCEELNRAAAAQLAEGDEEAILALAQENGIEKEDAEDYIDGIVPELATPLMAALGKLDEEKKDLGIDGVLDDWATCIVELCRSDEEMARAVRKRGKSLCGCMSVILRFAFENKRQVSPKIINDTKVINNGKEEPMRSPVYLGVPSQAETKRIVREYYLGGDSK